MMQARKNVKWPRGDSTATDPILISPKYSQLDNDNFYCFGVSLSGNQLIVRFCKLRWDGNNLKVGILLQNMC